MNMRDFLIMRQEQRGKVKINSDYKETLFIRETLFMVNEHKFTKEEKLHLIMAALDLYPLGNAWPRLSLMKQRLREDYLVDYNEITGKFEDYYGAFQHPITKKITSFRNYPEVFLGVEYEDVEDYREYGLTAAEVLGV